MAIVKVELSVQTWIDIGISTNFRLHYHNIIARPRIRCKTKFWIDFFTFESNIIAAVNDLSYFHQTVYCFHHIVCSLRISASDLSGSWNSTKRSSFHIGAIFELWEGTQISLFRSIDTSLICLILAQLLTKRSTLIRLRLLTEIHKNFLVIATDIRARNSTFLFIKFYHFAFDGIFIFANLIFYLDTAPVILLDA